VKNKFLILNFKIHISLQTLCLHFPPHISIWIASASLVQSDEAETYNH